MIDLNATFFAQIVNFLVLVFILKKLAYKPVKKILKEREDKIAESLNKADADVAEAQAVLEERRKALAEARTKAEEIVTDAEKRASETREDSIRETKNEIAQMKKAAAAEIQRDRARAMEQLRADVVSLSMAAAGKIIEKNIDKAQNEQIITEFVNKLDKDKVGDLPC